MIVGLIYFSVEKVFSFWNKREFAKYFIAMSMYVIIRGFVNDASNAGLLDHTPLMSALQNT